MVHFSSEDPARAGDDRIGRNEQQVELSACGLDGRVVRLIGE